jgi:hypothetical protein
VISFDLNWQLDWRIPRRTETFAVLARRGLDRSQKSAAHEFCTTESTGSGNLFYALFCFLKQAPGCLTPKLLDILSRRRSQLIREHAGKIAPAHRCVPGQLFHGQLFIQVLDNPNQKFLQGFSSR